MFLKLNKSDLKNTLIVSKKDNKGRCGLVVAYPIGDGTRAYIDHFWVHEAWRGKGLSDELLTRLYKKGLKRGVKSWFAIVKHDDYFHACLKKAADFNISVDSPYVLIQGEVR